MSGVEHLVAGEAAAQQAESAADAAKYNAAIQEQNAGLARAQGAEAQGRAAAGHRRVNAKFRAALAGQGITGAGSAFDLYQDNLEQQDLELRDLRYQSELEARGLMAEAERSRFEGRAAKAAKRNARVGAAVGAATATVKDAAMIYGGGG